MKLVLEFFTLNDLYSNVTSFQACGLVKNLALMTHITTDVNEIPLRRLARNSGVQDINVVASFAFYSSSAFLVILNGNSKFINHYTVLKFFILRYYFGSDKQPQKTNLYI